MSRIDFKLLLLVYKALNGPNTSLIYLYFAKPPDLAGPLGQVYLALRVKTKQGEAAFGFCAPHLWQTLPEYLRSAETVSSFWSGLKEFLFDAASE